MENWIKTGQPGTQIAAALGVSYPSLKDWKRRYWGDATLQRADLETENRSLKAELARVREQRDILKKRWHLHPLLPKTKGLHRLHKSRFGAPQIQDQLTKQGMKHGCKHMARLMKQAGLRGLSPKRYVPQTTPSDPDQPLAPNRLAQRSDLCTDGGRLAVCGRRDGSVES